MPRSNKTKILKVDKLWKRLMIINFQHYHIKYGFQNVQGSHKQVELKV